MYLIPYICQRMGCVFGRRGVPTLRPSCLAASRCSDMSMRLEGWAASAAAAANGWICARVVTEWPRQPRWLGEGFARVEPGATAASGRGRQM